MSGNLEAAELISNAFIALLSAPKSTVRSMRTLMKNMQTHKHEYRLWQH
jgi:hypothetical protein